MKQESIKKFTPVWFATVLGFGGIAVSSFLLANIFKLAWIKPIVVGVIYFNLILFLFLFLLWLLKLYFYSEIIKKELQSEVLAGFHSLLPASMIMVAITFAKIGPALHLWQYGNLSVIFWSIGAIFEFVFLSLSVYLLIVNESMHLNFMNGGWLVPPVAALLTPVAGLEILKFLNTSKVFVFWVNYFFFGVGFFIFLLIAGALAAKLFFLKKIEPKIFPSLWIILVPFSLISLSLALFVREIGGILGGDYTHTLKALVVFSNPMFIGVALWLIIILIFLTYHYFKKIELPYGESWWAFVFPVSSVAIASFAYALLAKAMFFAYCGLAVYFLLLLITLVVLVRTIKHFIN